MSSDFHFFTGAPPTNKQAILDVLASTALGPSLAAAADAEVLRQRAALVAAVEDADQQCATIAARIGPERQRLAAEAEALYQKAQPLRDQVAKLQREIFEIDQARSHRNWDIRCLESPLRGAVNKLDDLRCDLPGQLRKLTPTCLAATEPELQPFLDQLEVSGAPPEPAWQQARQLLRDADAARRDLALAAEVVAATAAWRAEWLPKLTAAFAGLLPDAPNAGKLPSMGALADAVLPKGEFQKFAEKVLRNPSGR